MARVTAPVASGQSTPDGQAYDLLTPVQELQALAVAVPTTFIVVSKSGNDTTGTGSFDAPYLTLAKARTVWTATRHTIIQLPGEYAEAEFTWPNITGLTWAMLVKGSVTITNSTQLPRLSPSHRRSLR